MHEQGKVENHQIQDEFTLGDKILVYPVFEPGCESVDVYLPEGDWYSYHTCERLTGGRRYTVQTPLEILPMFIKAGAIIPEYPVMQYTNQFEMEEQLLNIYFSYYDVYSFMYEDHGDNYAYEQNIYLEKKFMVTGSDNTLLVQQNVEGLHTPRYEHYRIKICGLPFNTSRIVCDRKEINDFHTDDAGNISFSCSKDFRNLELHA